MKTALQVQEEFILKLQNLLNEYGAELEAEDHYEGWAECGEDIRITVTVPSVYDSNHKCLREFVQIDLGRFMTAINKEATS